MPRCIHYEYRTHVCVWSARAIAIVQNDTCHDFELALSISGGGPFVYMFARHQCDVIILNDNDQNRMARVRGTSEERVLVAIKTV